MIVNLVALTQCWYDVNLTGVHTVADIMWAVGPTIAGTITLSISARDLTCGVLGVFPYPFGWRRSHVPFQRRGPLSGVLIPVGTAQSGAWGSLPGFEPGTSSRLVKRSNQPSYEDLYIL